MPGAQKAVGRTCARRGRARSWVARIRSASSTLAESGVRRSDHAGHQVSRGRKGPSIEPRRPSTTAAVTAATVRERVRPVLSRSPARRRALSGVHLHAPARPRVKREGTTRPGSRQHSEASTTRPPRVRPNPRTCVTLHGASPLARGAGPLADRDALHSLPPRSICMYTPPRAALPRAATPSPLLTHPVASKVDERRRGLHEPQIKPRSHASFTRNKDREPSMGI